MKVKTAIIGDGDSVLAFKAVGVDAFSVSDFSQARDLIKKIAKDYKIIFITDVLIKDLQDVVKKYLTVPYPVIISVPSKAGSNGYGMETIKKNMEKALGTNVVLD